MDVAKKKWSGSVSRLVHMSVCLSVTKTLLTARKPLIYQPVDPISAMQQLLNIISPDPRSFTCCEECQPNIYQDLQPRESKNSYMSTGYRQWFLNQTISRCVAAFKPGKNLFIGIYTKEVAKKTNTLPAPFAYG